MTDIRRTELTRILAEIDGIITEAKSPIAEPEDNDSRLGAAKVLEVMEAKRLDVEAQLRGE